MGGLGPGIGGLEYLLIAVAALIVVGPERLPGLLRKVGQWVAKARRMADEFRSSFDEMARQSELDDLRREVEALRTGQGMHRLGDDATNAFREIKADLQRPAGSGTPALVAPPVEPDAPTDQPVLKPAVEEWPDAGPTMMPLAAPVAAEEPKVKRAVPRKTTVKAAGSKSSSAPVSRATKKVATAASAQPAPRKTAGKTTGPRTVAKTKTTTSRKSKPET